MLLKLVVLAPRFYFYLHYSIITKSRRLLLPKDMKTYIMMNPFSN